MVNRRVNGGEKLYIWQSDDWPNWSYDVSALIVPLTDVSRAQGLLRGRLADVGMALRDQASLAVLTEDVVRPVRSRAKSSTWMVMLNALKSQALAAFRRSISVIGCWGDS